MNIYVVKPGDSLWSIARNFGVSMQRINEVNKLYEIPRLVIGQALVIPSTERAYMVKPGESLWSIGRRFNVSVSSIAALNGISSPYIINAGRVLRVPEASKNYGYIEVNAYIDPSTSEEDKKTIDEVGQYLTYISLFSYRVNPDGTLIPIDDRAILDTAKQYRNAPLLVITNFKNGTFDSDLGHTILTSDTVQQNLINNVIRTMKSKGYYGLNIDFEKLFPADKELYNNFLRKVVAALHPLNYIVTTALAPKISEAQVGAWYEAHDYKAHGEIVDFVVIMTYEWGWSGGPPLPVAPINQVRAVLNFALSVIPRSKIMMGMPLYGYNWALPYMPHGSFAPTVSPQKAISIAAKYGANIQYDWEAQSPFIKYVDEGGISHIIWFEDARSVQAKFRMASELGLRGVSYWVLGVSFPQNWAVLNDMFNIVKVIR